MEILGLSKKSFSLLLTFFGAILMAIPSLIYNKIGALYPVAFFLPGSIIFSLGITVLMKGLLNINISGKIPIRVFGKEWSLNAVGDILVVFGLLAFLTVISIKTDTYKRYNKFSELQKKYDEQEKEHKKLEIDHEKGMDYIDIIRAIHTGKFRDDKPKLDILKLKLKCSESLDLQKPYSIWFSDEKDSGSGDGPKIDTKNKGLPISTEERRFSLLQKEGVIIAKVKFADNGEIDSTIYVNPRLIAELCVNNEKINESLNLPDGYRISNRDR